MQHTVLSILEFYATVALNSKYYTFICAICLCLLFSTTFQQPQHKFYSVKRVTDNKLTLPLVYNYIFMVGFVRLQVKLCI